MKCYLSTAVKIVLGSTILVFYLIVCVSPPLKCWEEVSLGSTVVVICRKVSVFRRRRWFFVCVGPPLKCWEEVSLGSTVGVICRKVSVFRCRRWSFVGWVRWSLCQQQFFSFIQRMKRATRDNAQLPYPHLITTFMEHFGVPTETDPFTQLSLNKGLVSKFYHHLIIKKNGEGIWVHKDDVGNVQQEGGNEEPQVGNEEHEVRQPSQNPEQTSSTTLSEVIKQIQDLRTFVGDRFDRIDNRVGVVEQELINFRNQFDRQPPS
ncbi:hypothetical protein LR48_Vigan07g066100 [Vigna angularis]|uniref:Uncharacterized protein n=1 Tax=Phaseolus angularis TaxID=3914 RepID=A0A0L9UWM5_PHAAN|nr:hypothetical protein LR48_Vigan07g066100 [Vigna angularis]